MMPGNAINIQQYLPRPVPWVNGHLLWPATFAMYQILCHVNVPASGHLPDAASGQSNVTSCPSKADSDHE